MRRFHSQLLDFFWIPNYDASIAFLSRLAEPEPWDYSDAAESKHTILKIYLEHTFRKLRSEGKLCFTPDNGWVCFHTGLTTSTLEGIYALAEQNKNLQNEERDREYQPYVLKAFVRESDYQLMSRFPDRLPEAADFFRHPEEMVFDPHCRIVPQIDRIVTENIDRFPAHLQELEPEELRRRIMDAIGEVQRRARTHYNIAVPQYYEGRIQLLLPLRLTPASPTPDLALVAHKIGGNAYTARTCLTMHMAYNNARLIARPQSDWLKP